MEQIKPIVEVSVAGRRVREGDKPRPIDIVQSFELDALRAGYTADQLDPRAQAIARADWLTVFALDTGLARYFDRFFALNTYDDPAREAGRAATGFRMAQSAPVAQIVEEALQAYLSALGAQTKPDLSAHDDALRRAQGRYDLRGALNGALVSDPSLMNIVPDGGTKPAWAAHIAALPPAKAPLTDLPEADQGFLGQLLQAIDLPPKAAKVSPVGPNYLRIDGPKRRVFARKLPPERAEPGHWQLTDGLDPTPIVSVSFSAEPGGDLASAAIYEPFLASIGTDTAGLDALMKGNRTKAHLRVNAGRLANLPAFFGLQTTAGRRLPADIQQKRRAKSARDTLLRFGLLAVGWFVLFPIREDDPALFTALSLLWFSAFAAYAIAFAILDGTAEFARRKGRRLGEGAIRLPLSEIETHFLNY